MFQWRFVPVPESSTSTVFPAKRLSVMLVPVTPDATVMPAVVHSNQVVLNTALRSIRPCRFTPEAPIVRHDIAQHLVVLSRPGAAGDAHGIPHSSGDLAVLDEAVVADVDAYGVAVRILDPQVAQRHEVGAA